MYIIYDLSTSDVVLVTSELVELPHSVKVNNQFFSKEGYSYIQVENDEFDESLMPNYKVINGELIYDKPPAVAEPEPEDPSTDDDIVVGEPALEYMITTKCNEINELCHAAIINGIDVETSYGLEHFSLTEEDQSNIQQWYAIAKTADVNLPYHADDGDCKPYTNIDIIRIGSMATAHITHHTTYCNQLKKYVRTLTSVKDVFDVEYGVTALTGEFLEKYETCMGLLAVLN